MGAEELTGSMASTPSSAWLVSHKATPVNSTPEMYKSPPTKAMRGSRWGPERTERIPLTIQPDRLDLLDTITLKSGAHSSDSGEMCAMEAVAFIAGEAWSDRPDCVDPVLGAFTRAWNDGLPDDETRDRLLKPFIPRLVGTASAPDVQDARAFMASDWAVRVFTPAWLRKAGLHANADALVALPALSSVKLCKAAMPTIKRAHDSAAAAGAAAGAAARDAARDAAGDAAGAAAGAAARDAAGDAAWAAALAAAGAAAWAAAWAAALAAAGAAALAAAGAAARDAALAAAGAAARDAARAALADTVAELQVSATNLMDRMILVGAPS